MPSHADQRGVGGGDHRPQASGAPSPIGLDRNGLEVLDREECLRLLATVAICRIGITIAALPAILPVNFVVHDGLLLIRSVEGRNLYAAMRNTVVVVEADKIDEVTQTGWSVLVRGRAFEVSDPDQVTMARRLGLRSWVGDLDRLIAVRTDDISGRRIVSSSTRGT